MLVFYGPEIKKQFAEINFSPRFSDIYPKKYEENNELKEKNDFIALIASENVDEIERVIKDVKNNFDATMELSHENAKTGERINFTPLLLATMGGLDITVIEKLIDLGARINQVINEPATP